MPFLRSAIMLLAALVPASVAPAQVVPGQIARASASSELLIASNEIPKTVVPLIEPPVSDTSATMASDDQENASNIKKVPGESLAAMVSRLGTSEVADRQRECLATAIYFEAKSESLAGQLAVGEVLANRVKSGRFASSYCAVVKQRGQFSFVHNGSLPHVRPSAQWKNAVAIATIVDGGMMSSSAPRALFFHAKRVSPSWNATRVATIGNHVFYR